MLLYLLVKTPTFLISFFVTNKSSINFSKNKPQKTCCPLEFLGKFIIQMLVILVFHFFPKVICYTYQMKKDVLQEAVLSWNPV